MGLEKPVGGRLKLMPGCAAALVILSVPDVYEGCMTELLK